MCSSKTSNGQSENQANTQTVEPTIWTETDCNADECTFNNDSNIFASSFTNYDGGFMSDVTKIPSQYELYENTTSLQQCVSSNCTQTTCNSQIDRLNQIPFNYDSRQIVPFSSFACGPTRHPISEEQSYQSYHKSSSDLSATALPYQRGALVYTHSIQIPQLQQQEVEQQLSTQHIYGAISNQPSSVHAYTASLHRTNIITAAPQSSYYNQIQSSSFGGMSSLPAPCRGNQPWTYAYCYGYAQNNQEPCQFSQFVDIEDFMNNEKRKEKSRDAARCRRSRETEIFTDLAQVLPLKKEDVNQLDKASIMRIAIAYLKVREMLQLFPNIQEMSNEVSNNDSNALNDKSSKKVDENTFDLLKCSDAYEIIKQTLDGFLLILSNDGDITYVSESITEYLGLAKIDILGQQIWEYSHQCDHAELKDALNIKRNGMADKAKDEQILEDGLSTDHRDLFVRLKCTLTSRGRSINIKSASYKIVHLTGHLVVNSNGDRVLIAIGRPIPHPTNIEIPLCTTTFMTKHSLDMKFSYVDDKMLNQLGYTSEDLLEKSLFNFHHGSDTESLMATFKIVLSKGQGETCRYRFLGKYGGYCWIVTQATVVYDKLKPQSVVCVNYVISNLENEHEIYSLEQYEASQARVKTEEEIIIKNNNNNENNKNNNNNKEIKSYDAKETISTTTKTTVAATSTTVQNIKILTNESNNINNNNNNKNNNDNDNKPTITEIDNNSNPTTTTNLIKRFHLQLPSTTTIPPTTTVTHKFLSSKPNKTLSSPPRPKSVTASVFRAAPDILPNIVTKNHSNNNNNSTTDINTTTKNNNNNNVNNKIDIKTFSNPLQLNSTNVSTRAQSVTASVFTPISQIKKSIQQQQLNNNNNNKTTTLSTTVIAAAQQQQKQQDMNKGFLTFAEDATNELTMPKEEPHDLAHLAPSTTVVDACMPLDETTPLFGEMLVGLMGSYGSLLPDDINSLDSTTSSTAETTTATTNKRTTNTTLLTSATATKTTTAGETTANGGCTAKQNCSNNSNYNNNDGNETTTATTTSLNSKSSAHIDPFINYREESNDTNCSQHLLSPSVTSTSPEASSLPSLCSPNSLSQEDEFAFMTMNVDDDIDLTMRAPYIPMNEQDDLPLLTADDLMWCSSNAFSTDDIQMQKDIADVMQQQFQQLQQIQAACDNAHLRGNIIDFTGTPQQQSQLQHQQHQQHHINNHFPNSLCSSPASTVSSLSPSPVSNMQHNTQDTNSTTVFGGDSSELAALLCGTGSGTLTILGSTCDDDSTRNCGGIGGNIENNGGSGGIVNSNQQVNNCTADNSGGSNILNSDGINYRQQILLQPNQENLQQQQQFIGGLNIICKKEKFDANALATSLCDSIEDAFDNVYSKDSTTLDCWNDFMPINVNDATTVATVATTTDATQQQLDLEFQNGNCKQQLQQQQELLLNAVPLITIQNNKNVMLQQHEELPTHERILVNNNSPTNNNLNKLILNDEMLSAAISTTPINRNGKIATIKLLNGSTPNIRVLDGKLLQPQQQQTLPRNQTVTKTTIIQTIGGASQQHGSKRHLNPNSTQFETKRLKSGANGTGTTTVELQAIQTPQLLQQLIGSIQQQQQQMPLEAIKIEQKPQAQPQQQQLLQNQHHQQRKLINQRWSSVGNDLKQQQQPTKQKQQQQQQQQQQQSDSVLKNLLISGCDDIDTSKQEPLYLDESSLDKGSPTSPFSNASISPNNPTRCLTSTASVLRNYRHNPMIGGPGILPSPTFLHNEDSSSSPPDLITAYDATDSSSDSGLGDTSSMDTVDMVNMVANENGDVQSSLKLQLNENVIEKEQHRAAGSALLLMKCTNDDKKPTNLQLNTIGGSNDSNDVCIRRKTSISFMDSSNPLLTPFLMDLCNDDYNMNSGEFLEENDIDSVLNQWSPELV